MRASTRSKAHARAQVGEEAPSSHQHIASTTRAVFRAIKPLKQAILVEPLATATVTGGDNFVGGKFGQANDASVVVWLWMIV